MEAHVPQDAPDPEPDAKPPAPPGTTRLPESAAAWLDAIADGVLILEPDGRPLYVNPTLCALTGYPKDELLGLRLKDVLPADEAARSDSFRANRVAGRPAPIAYPVTVIRKDGTSLPVRISVGQAAWQGYPAVIAVIRDVSEQQRIEEEFRRLAGRARPSGDDVTDMFVRITPDGAVLFANTAFCDVVGLSPSEVVGRDILSITPGPYREDAPSRIEALYRDPGVSVSEAEMLLPGGRSMWFEWTARRLVDAQGRVVEFEIVGRDVTRARRAEEDLKRRDVILEAVASAAERLLGSGGWEERIDEILGRLRVATGVTRVHLWECEFAGDGDVRFVVRHRADPVPPPPVAPSRRPLFCRRAMQAFWSFWIPYGATNRCVDPSPDIPGRFTTSSNARVSSLSWPCPSTPAAAGGDASASRMSVRAANGRPSKRTLSESRAASSAPTSTGRTSPGSFCPARRSTGLS
jgi:PAS domain S-box-containing protein